jgi:hypothetical protein
MEMAENTDSEATTMKSEQATQSEDTSKMAIESMAKSILSENPIEAEDETPTNQEAAIKVEQIAPKPAAQQKNDEFFEMIPVQIVQIPFDKVPPVQARKAHGRKTFLFKADAIST